MATEIRELSPCKKVLLRDYGELFIQQGEKESLTVEADASLLNRISTQVQDEQLIISITGGLWDHFERFFRYGWQYTRVKLTLTVKDLNSLDVIGGGRVHVSRLNTEQLDIRLGGAGEINFEDLHAQKLTARLPGAGKIGISGEVDEQNISMSGAGAYIAHRLKSVHANVNLMGIGSVSIWAVESLAASLDGIGSISYYGHPTVQEDLRGFGKLIAMDTPQMSDVFPSSSPPSSQASSNYFRENDEEECSPFFQKAPNRFAA